MGKLVSWAAKSRSSKKHEVYQKKGMIANFKLPRELNADWERCGKDLLTILRGFS